jgi:hypothetical protein
MDHPYTKLLSVLDKARYVRYFPDLELTETSVESLDLIIEKHRLEEVPWIDFDQPESANTDVGQLRSLFSGRPSM